MRTGIYAILDTAADMYIGGLHLHKHEASAVRMFNDIAMLPDTIIGKHPEDFELIQLGHLEDDNKMSVEHMLVLTGKQWQQLQKVNQASDNNERAFQLQPRQ